MNLVNFYSFTSPYPQQFSIPSNIVYYILKYPFASSKGYKKLQKTCKYFYSKNPIVVVDAVHKNGYSGSISLRNDGYRYLNIYPSKALPKIWNIKTLYIFNKIEKKISDLLQGFYRFDAKSLIIQYQNLSYDELLLFASSPYVSEINLNVVNIHHSNGSMVFVEEIIQVFPKLVDFRYDYFGTNSILPITRDTVKKLSENLNFYNIKWLELRNIPETFDLITFKEYLKVKKDTNITLYFGENVSENYKIQLQNFVSWIINYAKTDELFYPPIVWFSGIDKKILRELNQVQTDYMSYKQFRKYLTCY